MASRKFIRPATRIPTVERMPSSITCAGCGIATVARAIRSRCGAAVPDLVPPVPGKSAVPASTTRNVAVTLIPPPIGCWSTSERNTSSDGLRPEQTHTAEPIRYSSPTTIASSHARWRPATAEPMSPLPSE